MYLKRGRKTQRTKDFECMNIKYMIMKKLIRRFIVKVGGGDSVNDESSMQKGI